MADREQSEVEAALSEAKATLAGTPSAAELSAANDKLTGVSHKLAEAMYKANASAPTDGATAAEGTTEEPKKDEGVIDAEYVDVENK